MELHKAPVLETLCMELGPRCPSDANFEKFVAKAIDRRVLRLELELRWPPDLTRLPKSLYTCKTLVDLTLSHKILVDFPCYSCFPSLTHLFLHYVVYEDEASLARLLSSCPVLERLSVKRRKDDNVTKFSVKVPTLWLFVYENYNNVEDDGMCLAMDTLALTNFCIADYSGDSCSIKNMPCFEVAFIHIVHPYPYIDNFLKSFSSVLSLELLLTDEMIVRCSNIKFSQLKKFKISPCDSDWMDSLVPLLTNTPKLKYLIYIVDYRATHLPAIASATWRDRGSYYPECLYSSLEKLELIDYGGREEEEGLVEYILSTSRCLKTAIIYLKTTLEHENKVTMVEELKALYRYSKTCRLLFQTES